MSVVDAALVRRRFLLLSATRWLPTGILIPTLIVVMQQRGLSLATIGVISAIGSAVVLTLELPTGGLADTLGRRPVLIVASLFNLASMTIIALAGSATWFIAAWVIEGIYRALESGPLESWYVDAAQAADPDADIETGLARKGMVLSVAIGAGALLGGGLALLPQPSGLPVLALPVLVAVGLRLVDIAALATLLREPRRGAGGPRGWSAAMATVRGTGRTVREAVGLMRASAALLALAAIELFWGAGMTGVEIFSGPRLVELLGDPQQAVAAYAVANAVAWIVSGLGSAAAPWLARLTGGWVRAGIITRVAQGLGVLAAALIAGPAGLLIGYLGFYLVHGAANVAHQGLTHRNVGAAHRTTVLSAISLTSRLGGVIFAPILGLIASGAGIPMAFAASALLLALPAPLFLFCRDRQPTAEKRRGPALVAGPSE